MRTDGSPASSSLILAMMVSLMLVLQRPCTRSSCQAAPRLAASGPQWLCTNASAGAGRRGGQTGAVRSGQVVGWDGTRERGAEGESARAREGERERQMLPDRDGT